MSPVSQARANLDGGEAVDEPFWLGWWGRHKGAAGRGDWRHDPGVVDAGASAEVWAACELLQALGLPTLAVSVTACSGCGRTTLTTFDVA